MSFFKYLRESIAELKHISWPTSKQAGQYTLLVVVISLFAAAYIGVFDRIFTTAVDFVLNGPDSTVTTPQEIAEPEDISNIIESVSVESATVVETEVETN